MMETKLYPPLKSWLEKHGYTVRGEVGRCDIAALKDGHLIVIELKTRASMNLLAQALERQAYADAVYIALPASSNQKRPPSMKNLRRLLRRLGIGLVLVVFLNRSTRIEILMHPGNTESPKRPKKRAAILREITGRDMDLTPGGLAGGPGRVSAYRQRAIRLASWLSVLGESTPAALKRIGAPEDTGNILAANLYGWFFRVRRGVYRLHDAGVSALGEVPELSEKYLGELPR